MSDVCAGGPCCSDALSAAPCRRNTATCLDLCLLVIPVLQILVATSTLAWGVNTPAHLVVIKGTEYYDAPSKRYVDFPITDVLQVCPHRDVH